MLVDEFPDWHSLGPKSPKGSAVTIHLYVQDVEAFFKQAVAAGAKVTMPPKLLSLSNSQEGYMRYVDGFVLPVPKKNLKAYFQMAKKAGKIWKEHGALEYV